MTDSDSSAAHPGLYVEGVAVLFGAAVDAAGLSGSRPCTITAELPVHARRFF